MHRVIGFVNVGVGVDVDVDVDVDGSDARVGIVDAGGGVEVEAADVGGSGVEGGDVDRVGIVDVGIVHGGRFDCAQVIELGGVGIGVGVQVDSSGGVDHGCCR